MSSLINLARILNRIIILPALPCAEGIQAEEWNLCGFRPDDCWEGFQQIRHGEWREHVGLESRLIYRRSSEVFSLVEKYNIQYFTTLLSHSIQKSEIGMDIIISKLSLLFMKMKLSSYSVLS